MTAKVTLTSSPPRPDTRYWRRRAELEARRGNRWVEYAYRIYGPGRAGKRFRARWRR